MQSVLTSVVAALILWVGLSVSNQGKAIAMLTERVASLQSQIANLHSKPILLREDFVIMVRPMVDSIKRNEVDIIGIKDCIEQIKKDLYVSYPNHRKVVQQ